MSLTTVYKCIFVCDIRAPAKLRVAKIRGAICFQFAGDTDAASAHLKSLEWFTKLTKPGERKWFLH